MESTLLPQEVGTRERACRDRLGEMAVDVVIYGAIAFWAWLRPPQNLGV